jgi:hypothetical protein
MPMTAPVAENAPRSNWLSDFEWGDGRVRIRKTDIALDLDGKLWAEVARWLPYLAILSVRAGWARTMRALRGQQRSIWFAPERPRPWYLARGAALWAGIAMAHDPAQADVAFYFDDVTTAEVPGDAAAGVNAACADVSKSHVAAVFESVFGYPLSVDPATWSGPMIEKSEKNGVHDGRIFLAGEPVRADCVYQRLVDTADETGSAHDLRTLWAGGAPVLVWEKIKPGGTRFAIHNRKARLKAPTAVFTPEEIALIGQFTARMGLDWGGLDILRDRHDGRIYIVDVNKTDVGPVIALSWADKIRSMSLLGRAMEGLLALRVRPALAEADAARPLPVRATSPGGMAHAA